MAYQGVSLLSCLPIVVLCEETRLRSGVFPIVFTHKTQKPIRWQHG
jgi:hypothetical protein